MRRDVAKHCHIYQALKAGARKKHLSFHTPGHKRGKWDITELSYTDNLSAPTGCILRAEEDIARILGADKSFILTDGSTAGVFSMLHAAKTLGARTIALPLQSHKSVFNGCALLGLTPLPFETGEKDGIPNPPDFSILRERFSKELQKADAILLTSPTYYGNVPDLAAFSAYCQREGKLLLIDGAHGGHLRFTPLHAGKYADIWVDGVHKSLPALTQGAVVSARGEAIDALQKSVDIFRTTSPSYPVMASVEYAVKYPRNPSLEKRAQAFQRECPRAIANEDWTKLGILFGENAFSAHDALEKRGIYPEFCDGNVVLFYLSPATSARQWRRLKKELAKLLREYPYIPKKVVQRIRTPLVCVQNLETEWVDLDSAAGRVCANTCGLFPPCTPLIFAGEVIDNEKLALLKRAVNVYGLTENKILAVKDEQR